MLPIIGTCVSLSFQIVQLLQTSKNNKQEHISLQRAVKQIHRFLEAVPPHGVSAEGNKVLGEWCPSSQLLPKDQMTEKCTKTADCNTRKLIPGTHLRLDCLQLGVPTCQRRARTVPVYSLPSGVSQWGRNYFEILPGNQPFSHKQRQLHLRLAATCGLQGLCIIHDVPLVAAGLYGLHLHSMIWLQPASQPDT